jgi:hypothetical protein
LLSLGVSHDQHVKTFCAGLPQQKTNASTVKRAVFSKKVCKVKGNKLMAIKAGSCLATVTVQGDQNPRRVKSLQRHR